MVTQIPKKEKKYHVFTLVYVRIFVYAWLRMFAHVRQVDKHFKKLLGRYRTQMEVDIPQGVKRASPGTSTAGGGLTTKRAKIVTASTTTLEALSTGESAWSLQHQSTQ